jgi:trimethylamine--corrinoid protein Co-methyltransferase
MQAGVNFNLHTAGWLEGGLSIGYEKFILDADQASMAASYVSGVAVDANGQALDALLENGPGQHFLGHPHTLANFESAFWRSQVSDNNSFEQWTLEGSNDAAQRANSRWKRLLADYEMPPLEDSTDDELSEWIERRSRAFPDSDV